MVPRPVLVAATLELFVSILPCTAGQGPVGEHSLTTFTGGVETEGVQSPNVGAGSRAPEHILARACSLQRKCEKNNKRII